jgi:hypothetical protein
MPRLRGLLGYAGTATLVQGDAIADVECVRYYAEGEASWWGRFYSPNPANALFADGAAIFRFPGGDDAVVQLSGVRSLAGRYTVVEWLDGRAWPEFARRWRRVPG